MVIFYSYVSLPEGNQLQYDAGVSENGVYPQNSSVIFGKVVICWTLFQTKPKNGELCGNRFRDLI